MKVRPKFPKREIFISLQFLQVLGMETDSSPLDQTTIKQEKEEESKSKEESD